MNFKFDNQSRFECTLYGMLLIKLCDSISLHCLAGQPCPFVKL